MGSLRDPVIYVTSQRSGERIAALALESEL
jgi:hypothetical protein